MDVAASLKIVKGLREALKVLMLLKLTSIHWPQQAKVTDGASFDYIIVGGGSAGCVLANRLTEEKNCQVLLIEAGGEPPFESMLPGLPYLLPKTSHDWNYTAAYDKNRQIYQEGKSFPLIQGKMLGGSSSLNYMFYVRGHPHDYQTWADIAGDQTWNYENVLPYFKKSEFLADENILHSKYKEFHGTRGFLHVSRYPHPDVKPYEEMFRELGYNILLDVNGNETLGYGQPMFTAANGVRQSTAFAFLRPVKDRNNLHVLKSSQVTKVLFDNSKNAIGVQALSKDIKLINLFATREVIVTAGGINSAKLLLLSGVGPEAHLKKFGINTVSNLPVGDNLQDHPGAVMIYQFKKSNNPPPVSNPSKIATRYLNGYIALDKLQTYPDCQAITGVDANDADGSMINCLTCQHLDYDICQKISETGKGRETLSLNMNLLHGKSRGVIQLNSTNPLDEPLVFLRYFSDESDLDKLAGCMEEFDRIRNSSHFKNVGGAFVDFKLPKCASLRLGSREYWKCHILSMRYTVYHFSGACSMGRVVDSRLRVRGVQRLRVADSSAIPYMPSGNTNAATIMLAEKAADMIKEDNGCQIKY